MTKLDLAKILYALSTIFGQEGVKLFEKLLDHIDL